MLLAIGVALLASAVLGTGASSVDAATVGVDVQDSQFSPPTINIQAGDTVEWEFVGTLEHNVTAVDNSFSSATMSSGTFSRAFNSAGSFAYYCTIHGTAQGQGMAGTVVVAAAATATNTAEAAAPSPTRTATGTPEATSTPATATATGTAAAVATATVEVIPISAPVDDLPSTTGAAAPGAVGAPNAGTGPRDGDVQAYSLAILLAAAGAASIGSALLLALRRTL
jgi:plastocyanin